MGNDRLAWMAAAVLAGGPLFAGCKPGIVHARAALDFQCPEDEVQIEELPGWTFHARGCGKDAVYVCTETGGSWAGNGAPLVGLIASSASLSCFREPSHAAAAPPPPPPPVPVSPFPDGVVGFSFGKSQADTAAACQAASGTWSAQGDFFACSVAPQPIGAPAAVALRFCGNAACRIDVWTQPAGSETWIDRFVSLRTTLFARYGAPTFEGSEVSASCRQDVLACLVDGKARFWTGWRWPARHALTLEMGKLADATAIRIVYERPEGLPSQPL